MPRFTLRTLLVAVALLGVPLGWVGWQIKIVRDRQVLLNHLRIEGAQIMDVGHARVYFKPDADESISWLRDGDTSAGPAWFRKRLGDREINFIYLQRMPLAADSDLPAYFPEADIFAWAHPRLIPY